jgi:hypothetical protein
VGAGELLDQELEVVVIGQLFGKDDAALAQALWRGAGGRGAGGRG